MFAACLLQWILKDYLLYGLAEALGTLVLYLSNHNYNDLIDLRTDLYNRRTALEHLKDIRTSGQECVLVGVAVFDQQFKDQNVSDGDIGDYADSFAYSFTRFLYHKFGLQNTFAIETNVYLVTVENETYEDTVSEILDRFSNLWKIRGKEFYLIPGIAIIHFPKEADQINQAFDLLTEGVRTSSENHGEIMHIDDIIDEKERRINSLEKQQEQLEKQYLETEDKMNKAVIADRSKSLFLAQMSHEIRTPMTAILGMTELLLRDSKDKTVINHANAIMSSGKSLLGIINDILDFSKIESGKLTIVNDKYMMSSVVYDLVVALLQRVHEKQLTFRVRFEPNIPAYLIGDEIRVKQLIFNLLTNACKYTQKGHIDFEVKGKREGSKYMMIIKISDTGIGIRKENLSRIFERFERFDPEINKSIEGTGLGLAIVRQLVELMDGSIRVESEYGVGSTFTVTLPQGIADQTPSVLIDRHKTDRYAYCFESAMLQEDMADACLALHIDHKCVYNLDELGIYGDDETYTGIFVDNKVFQKLVLAGSKMVFDKRVVCVHEYAETVKNYNGRLFKTPISSLNLGAFINGSSLTSAENIIEKQNYCAPSARILVVDDNAVNLKIFKSLCEPHGFIIDSVESGDECIRYTQTNIYDIIFLDHMMPHKDGIDTIREIMSSEDNKNRKTPFIAFTANAVSGMKEMFLDVGFTDFLSKPIEISALEQMLLKYLPKDKIIFGTLINEDAEINEDENAEEKKLNMLSEIGIDTNTALEYAGGSFDTFMGVLDVFVSDGRKKITLMKDQISNEDYSGFTTQIHAVKSLTRGIGIASLPERALALEMAGKNGDIEYINKNFEEVLKDYNEIIDKIDIVINSNGGTLS